MEQSEVKDLLNHLPIQKLAAREPLITHGDPVRSLYVVIEGELEVFTDHFTDQLATLSFGASVGEMSLIEDGQVACASVRAGQAGVQLLQIPKSVLEQQILHQPHLAANFYRGLCVLLSKRLRTTNNLVRIKIDEIKTVTLDILNHAKLASKVSHTKESIEDMGLSLVDRLSQLISSLDESMTDLEEDKQKLLTPVRTELETIMLEDLQNIDEIAQKLDILLQYLSNMEAMLEGHTADPTIRGDLRLFQAS
jgi:CRP-like cAMP-binding protein